MTDILDSLWDVGEGAGHAVSGIFSQLNPLAIKPSPYRGVGNLVNLVNLTSGVARHTTGRLAFGLVKGAKMAAKATAKKLLQKTEQRVITGAAKAALSGGKAFGKGFKEGVKASKGTKAATIVGVVDLGADLLVSSDMDDGLWGLIPGAGISEGLVAGVNWLFGTNFMNARPVWVSERDWITSRR